jgi:hypothetical protein
MSDAAAAAIERLRDKLIDLSASNRLLNFKHPAGVSGSQSALRFVGKPLDQLFTRLRDQKSLIVEPVPPPSDRDLRQFYSGAGNIPGLQSEDARNLSKPDPERWARYLGWDVSYELPVSAEDSDGDHHQQSGRVRTLLYPDQLEVRLRRLRSNARLAIEESGSNMLFFAVGFLEWYEKPPQNDRQPYRAPLILVPATIEPVKNAQGVRSLTISSTGEDLQENLSLRKKLAVDFGIDLPEFDNDESPDSYFDRVYQVVARQDAWRIRRFVTLTLFTNLGKLLLYLDLDPDRWPEDRKPADHKIVRCLVGDGGGGHSAARPLPSESEIAKKIDLDLCLVDRADATQARVLLDALDGQNLVIQGPLEQASLKPSPT